MKTIFIIAMLALASCSKQSPVSDPEPIKNYSVSSNPFLTTQKGQNMKRYTVNFPEAVPDMGPYWAPDEFCSLIDRKIEGANVSRMGTECFFEIPETSVADFMKYVKRITIKYDLKEVE